MSRSVFPRRSLSLLIALPLSLAFAAFVSNPVVQAQPTAPVVAPPVATAPENQLVVAQGTVLNAEGKPIKGASVTALSLTKDEKLLAQIAVQTDAQGRFTVEGSIPSEAMTEIRKYLKVEGQDLYLVAIIHAPGYAVSQKLLKGNPTKGPNLPPNELSLARGFDATGRVIDKNGKGVAGVIVQAESAQKETKDYNSPENSVWLGGLAKDNPLKREFQVASDKDGYFTLHDLPLGTLRVTLADPRFMTQAAGITVSDKPVAKDKIPTITAQVGARLRGRVLYPDGKPVAGVEVTASNVVTPNATYSETKVTNPDGTYDFGSIRVGKTVISVDAPSEEWAKTTGPTLQIKEGEETKAGDITISRGLMLTGYVREAESKAPVVGIKVAVQKDTSNEATIVTTDAQGRYQARVQPGRYKFYISETPPDFLQYNEEQLELTVTPESKTAPELSMQRGATLTGTAKDENGQPAVGAVITVNNYGPDATATVDAEGNWSLRGLDTTHDFTGQGKGNIKLRISGPWSFKGKTTVKLPSPPLNLTLARIKLQDVTVRVVTTTGQPVADAKVKYQFFTTSEGDSWQNNEATTNAQGEVKLEGLRPENPVELTATKQGYILSQKGRISLTGGLETKLTEPGLLHASDVIMAPLDAKVTGRVLDAKGQPAKGARVALLFPTDLRDLPDSSALTNDQGQFALEGLPQGEVTLGVALGRAFGQATAKANGTAELKLSEDIPLPAPQNTEAAFALLERWIKDAREGKKGGNRQDDGLTALALRLVPYDAERAQRLMTDDQGNLNQEFMGAAPLRLAATNPQRAVVWVKTLLPLIKDQDERTTTKIQLAALAAAADPAWARQVYDEIAPGVAPTDLSAESALRYAQLAGLAAALKDPDAEGWSQALALCMNAMTEEERGENTDSIITALANGNEATARKWAAQLPPLTQLSALDSLTTWSTKHSLATAPQIVGDMDALIHRPDFPAPKPRNDDNYEPSPSDTLGFARTKVASALSASDPNAARKFVESLSDGASLDDNLSAEITARTATAQDEDKMKLALDAARNDWQSPAGKMAFLASLISETLPQLSEQTFKEAREKLANRSDNGRGGESGATYAYVRANYDPAASRLLLENDWLRTTNEARLARQEAKHNGNSWETLERMRGTIYAMIPLSLERANEMLEESLTLSDQMQWNSHAIRVRMINWLLADAQTRRTTPLQRDGEDDSDEE